MKILKIIPALLLSSCALFAPDEMTEFKVSSDFDDRVIEVLKESADDWCDVSGICWNVSVVDPGSANVLPSSDLDGASGKVLFVGGKPTYMYLLDNLNTHTMGCVVRHEMGHAFGQRMHMPPDKIGVMAGKWDDMKASGCRVTIDDVDFLNQ